MGAPAVDPAIVEAIRDKYTGTLILSGGYDAERAEDALANGKADLVAFGRPFIANPDLVERLETGAELNQPDFSTFLYARRKRLYRLSGARRSEGVSDSIRSEERVVGAIRRVSTSGSSLLIQLYQHCF